MKFFPRSLEGRTSVAIAIAFFIFLSLFFYTSYLSIRRSLLNRSDGEVRAELTEVIRALRPGISPPQVSESLEGHHAIGESSLRFIVLERNDNGFRRLDSIRPDIFLDSLVLARIESQPENAFPISTSNANMRVVSLESGNFIVAARYNTIALEEAERSIIETFSYYLIAGLIVGIFGGMFLSRYLIGPIGTLAESARKLVGRKASVEMDRLPVTTKVAEVAALAESINALLDARDRALEHERNFAADAAHELRTPLTVLKGEIEVELRTTGATGSHAELLRSNLEEIERLIGTVQDLLELAEIEAGQAESQPGAKCSLQAAITYAAERLRPIAEERGIQITLPENDVVLRAHEERITRLIYNLLLNAIQHSHRGTNVEVKISENKSGPTLEITDRGDGIVPGSETLLFERFRRGDSARHPNGVGLGLAIAKSITDYYGFKLDLRQNPHGGITVHLDIPESAVCEIRKF